LRLKTVRAYTRGADLDEAPVDSFGGDDAVDRCHGTLRAVDDRQKRSEKVQCAADVARRARLIDLLTAR